MPHTKGKMFLIIGRTIKTLLRVHYTMLATSTTLLIVSILPGYALCKVLDGTADKYRKAMLKSSNWIVATLRSLRVDTSFMVFGLGRLPVLAFY